jgi:hypothetical protein
MLDIRKTRNLRKKDMGSIVEKKGGKASPERAHLSPPKALEYLSVLNIDPRRHDEREKRGNRLSFRRSDRP